MTPTDLLLQWFIASLALVVLALRRRPTAFDPAALYLVFHGIAYCVRPTALALWGGESSWGFLRSQPAPDALRHALWVSSVGLVSFLAAYLTGSRGSQPLRDAAPAEFDLSQRRALVIVGVAAAAVALGAGYAAWSAKVQFGYAPDLLFVLLPVAVVIAVNGGWRSWSLVPLMVWITARAAVTPAVLALTGAALAVMVAWLWSHQRRRPSMLLVAAAATFGLAGLSLDVRSTWESWFASREAPRMGASEEQSLRERMNRPAWAHFEALAGMVDGVPARVPHSAGRQHLAALASVGTTERWAASSASAGAVGRELAAIGSFRAVPLGLPADSWWSGGWVGVVVVLGLAGFVLGTVYAWFSRHQDAPAAIASMSTALALVAPLYWHGDVAQTIRGGCFAALPLLAWHLLAQRLRHTQDTAADRERLREERQRRRLLGTALLNPHAAALPPEALAAAARDSKPAADDAIDPANASSHVTASASSPRRRSPPSPNPDAATPQPASRPAARWRDIPPTE